MIVDVLTSILYEGKWSNNLIDSSNEEIVISFNKTNENIFKQ